MDEQVKYTKRAKTVADWWEVFNAHDTGYGTVVISYGTLRDFEEAIRAEAQQAWERVLVGLTPGGSEFVGDPETCARFVRERLETVISVQKRAMAAEGRLAAAGKLARALANMIREWCEIVGDEEHNSTPADTLEKARKALAEWEAAGK